MYCTKCGKEIHEEWKACPYCGNELKTQFQDSCDECNDSDDNYADKEDNKDADILQEDVEQPSKNDGDDNVDNSYTEMKEQPMKQIFAQRSFWKYLGLSLITFGIYSIYFWYKFVQDINELCEGDGKKSPNYILVMLLSIITLGIYGWYWYYTQGERLYNVGRQYGIPVREKGGTILAWKLVGVFTGQIGSFVSDYILIDNFNFLVSDDLEKGKIEKNHPHLVRNACIAIAVYFVVILLPMIVLMFAMTIGDFGDDTNVEENKYVEESAEKMNDLSSVDMETLLGKTEEEMEKEGFVIPEDDVMAYNGDVSVGYSEDGKVNMIIIEGDEDIAPSFHKVTLGDSKEVSMKKLEDAYSVLEDHAEMGFSRINVDTGECVTCFCENQEVSKIMYWILSKDELKEVVEKNIEVSPVETYIFPDSDKKYLSEDEVRRVPVDKLFIGRNEIFARHGRMFDTPELAEYFSQQSWYNGTIPANQFDNNVLNDFEKKNAELIKRIEDEINGVSTRPVFNPNEYTDLMRLWAGGSIPAEGTKVFIGGWVTGHTGGTIFLKPHQLVPDMFVYYDNSQYTPVDGAEITVYGTFGGEVVNGQYSMDGFYFTQ